MSSLNGKVVLVTGSARGIGRAVAVACARLGADLVISGRSTKEQPNRGGLPGTLQSVEAELGDLGASVLAVRADLSKPDDVDGLVEAAKQRFGGVDVLVNNALWLHGPVAGERRPEGGWGAT